MRKFSRLIKLATEGETLIDKAQQANEAQDSSDPAIMRKATDFDEEIKALKEQGQVGGEDEQEGGQTDIPDEDTEDNDNMQEDFGDEEKGSEEQEPPTEEELKESEQEIEQDEEQSKQESKQIDEQESKVEQAQESAAKILSIANRYYAGMERGYLSPIAKAIISEELSLERAKLARFTSEGFAPAQENFAKDLYKQIKDAIKVVINWITNTAKNWYNYISNLIKNIRARFGLYSRTMDGVRRRLIQSGWATVKNGLLVASNKEVIEIVGDKEIELSTWFKPDENLGEFDRFGSSCREYVLFLNNWLDAFSKSGIDAIKLIHTSLFNAIRTDHTTDARQAIEDLTKGGVLDETTGLTSYSARIVRGINCKVIYNQSNKFDQLNIYQLFGRINCSWKFPNTAQNYTDNFKEANRVAALSTFQFTDTAKNDFIWNAKLRLNTLVDIINAYDYLTSHDLVSYSGKIMDEIVMAYTESRETLMEIAKVSMDVGDASDFRLTDSLALCMTLLQACDRLYIKPLRHVIETLGFYQATQVKNAIKMMTEIDKTVKENSKFNLSNYS